MVAPRNAQIDACISDKLDFHSATGELIMMAGQNTNGDWQWCEDSDGTCLSTTEFDTHTQCEKMDETVIILNKIENVD